MCDEMQVYTGENKQSENAISIQGNFSWGLIKDQKDKSDSKDEKDKEKEEKEAKKDLL